MDSNNVTHRQNAQHRRQSRNNLTPKSAPWARKPSSPSSSATSLTSLDEQTKTTTNPPPPSSSDDLLLALKAILVILLSAATWFFLSHTYSLKKVVPHGYAISFFLVLYHTTMWNLGRYYSRLTSLYAFTGPISVLMVFPDRILVELGVLNFPEDGIFHLLASPYIEPFNKGGVSFYMILMWAIPFTLILMAVEFTSDLGYQSNKFQCFIGGFVSLLIIGGSEFVMHPIGWNCKNISWSFYEQTAAYVLLPEVLLGVCLTMVWQFCGTMPSPSSL
eukprot:Awhi_evm1s14598